MCDIVNHMEVSLLRPKDLHMILSTTFEGGHFDIIDDRAFFKDPVTQELLIPGVVPPSIQQDAIFGPGIRHLKQLGESNRLSVRFLFGSHGSAQDFDKVIRLLPFGEKPHFMGIESSWSAPEGVESPALWQVQPVVVSAQQAAGRHAFQMAQNLWSKKHGVLTLPCQPQLNSESLVISHLERLWDIYQEATDSRRDTDFAFRNAIRALAERSYQSVRQWLILAQFGGWLLRLEEQGELSDEQVIPLMLGRWHARSQDRLRFLGVPCSADFAPIRPELDTPDYIAFGEVVMRNTYECNASLEDLQVPIPY